jgi:hypothetical protein
MERRFNQYFVFPFTVAEQVAAGTHRVGGRPLEVTLAPIEDPTPPNTVMVQGCDPGQQEVLSLYFENPRKGGGDIKDIRWQEDLQAFLITFEEADGM